LSQPESINQRFTREQDDWSVDELRLLLAVTDGIATATELAGVNAALRQALVPVLADDCDVTHPRTGDAAEPRRSNRESERSLALEIVSPAQTTIGTLSLRRRPERDPFTDADVRLAQAIARRVAVALPRVMTRGRTADALDRLARLQQVTAAFSRALTPAQVAEIVIQQSMATLGAALGSMLMLNEERTALELIGAVNYPDEVLEPWRSIPMSVHVQATEAVRTGEAIWIRTRAEAVERYPVLANAPITDSRAFAAIPLVADGEPVGVMGLSFPEPRDFLKADKDFVSLLAQQGAFALERARLYEQEARARAMAEAAVRNREEFLSIAAHELRTPLTSIKGAAQMLQRQVHAAQPNLTSIARFTDLLDDQVDRLTALVSDLLDVSRLGEGRLELQLEENDLVPIARLVLRQFEHAPERQPNHRFRLIAPDPVIGAWDATRIEQVLVNLVSNALKYSTHGGEVSVRIAQDGGFAVIQVQDQGIGIPEEERAALFQPFARTSISREVAPGTGLGLYISQRIVTWHRGTLEVDSTLGSGSTFTVRLPIAATSAG
jgi:signal transduction histidine kinase